MRHMNRHPSFPRPELETLPRTGSAPATSDPAGSGKGALALSRNPRTPDSAAASDRDTHCRGQGRCSLAALQIAGGHEDSIGRNPFMEHIDQDKTELPKRK